MIGQKGAPATFGGVERHVEELSAHLAARGHRVTVFVRPGYTKARGAYRGFVLRPLPSLPTKHLDAATHTALCTVTSLFEPFDVLHYHAVGPALFSVVPRCLGRRVVATIHALDWQRAKWGRPAEAVLRLGGRIASCIPHQTIAVSRTLQSYYESRGRRPVWIPNGVDAPRRGPLERLKRFGVESKRFVLWMGRFVPEKRCEDLIAAFLASKTNAKLLLAGEMDFGDEYCRRLRGMAEGDERIIFAGGLYGPDKDEALWHAAVVVLPSELEGLPLVLLEAMAVSACVAATRLEPCRELIRPGRTGLLFDVHDRTALRSAIEWALQHPAEATVMGERACASLGEDYSWPRIAERTEAVYERALGLRGAGSGV
jgi:glycosyltransferase involved in cell wall biosynthesis